MPVPPRTLSPSPRLQSSHRAPRTNPPDLGKAANLIRDLGYGRRYDELADADEATKDWPT